uniref:Aminoglycoside phosphotransferase n=1 Tax=uncultured organism TaxID=155900 RepID=M1PQD3_9ZZZZ|nr:aminoglycoside phosphotransferase [uncultured organism]
MSEIKKSLLKNIFLKYEIKVKEIKPVATGKFNQTYVGKVFENNSSFEIPNKKIILRIAPPDDAGFVFYEKNMMAREPKIHNIVQKNTSIPIPDIYVYDNNREIIDRDFLLMEYIPGKPMSDLKISTKVKQKIMKSTGKYLRELHQNCKYDKFGYPENIGMELTASWVKAFETMWFKLIDDLKRCNIYNKRQAQKAKKTFSLYRDLFDKNLETAPLLHMDIWSQNIMIDQQGNITGIVDWDRGVWGDPEIEFAVLDYTGFDNPAFWDGYGFKPEISEEERIRGKFYHLYEVQKYPVIWTCRAPNPSRTEKFKEYSLKILEELNSSR